MKGNFIAISTSMLLAFTVLLSCSKDKPKAEDIDLEAWIQSLIGR